LQKAYFDVDLCVIVILQMFYREHKIELENQESAWIAITQATEEWNEFQSWIWKEIVKNNACCKD
jgi:hypothetical protein